MAKHFAARGTTHPSLKPYVGLDVIKAFSISLIVFHHYQQVFDCTFDSINFFNGTFYFGYLVELFFLVSGFLALHSLKRQDGAQSLGYYARCFCRKAVRIYPTTTIALIFVFVVKLRLHALPEGFGMRAAFANTFLLFRGWPGLSMYGLNNPTWYLCILLQCLALFYVCEWVCDRLPKSIDRPLGEFGISMALVGLSTYLYWINVIEDLAYRGYSSFFLGVAIYTVNRYLDERLTQGKTWTGLACLAGAAYFVFAAPSSGHQHDVLTFGAWPLLTTAATLLTTSLSSKQRLCQISRVIGATGFQVFVWHSPLMSFERLLHTKPGLPSFDRSYLSMAMFTAVCWLFGYVFHVLVEKRINSLLIHPGS